MTKQREMWFSIDVETSGSVPGLYDLVSIGACVIGDLKGGPKFYEEIVPHGGLWSPEAEAIHNLSQEHLRQYGRDPKIAIVSFNEWVVATAGQLRPVFASWGSFDWMWMGYYLEKFGKKYTYPFGPNSLELKSYYLGLVKGPEWRVTAKSRMPKEDLSGHHLHNALSDAIEQAAMVEAWQKKYAGDEVPCDCAL